MAEEKDILNLYDFEVDENEPVAKKTKRKPILKMGSKKFRTYKRKNKVISVLPPLNLSNEENVCPNAWPVAKVAQENSKNNNKKCTNSNDHNTSISSVGPALSVGNTSFCNEIDSSINSVIEAREQMLYSPQPYQSPKRDSLSVPIVRSSISHINENECIKSLNGSTSSSKYNATINSPFSAHFASPMYMGSSTPIRSHWTEQTNANLNANETDLENFDVSNYFGFNDSASIDEPFVSPIKYYATPGKTPVRVCRKPSPQKIPTSQVIRMLKFGADAINVSNDDDSQLDNSVELPEDFFHDGQTPDYDYSPGHTPPTPMVSETKMVRVTRRGRVKAVDSENVSPDAPLVKQKVKRQVNIKTQSKPLKPVLCDRTNLAEGNGRLKSGRNVVNLVVKNDSWNTVTQDENLLQSKTKVTFGTDSKTSSNDIIMSQINNCKEKARITRKNVASKNQVDNSIKECIEKADSKNTPLKNMTCTVLNNVSTIKTLSKKYTFFPSKEMKAGGSNCKEQMSLRGKKEFKENVINYTLQDKTINKEAISSKKINNDSSKGRKTVKCEAKNNKPYKNVLKEIKTNCVVENNTLPKKDKNSSLMTKKPIKLNSKKKINSDSCKEKDVENFFGFETVAKSSDYLDAIKNKLNINSFVNVPKGNNNQCSSNAIKPLLPNSKPYHCPVYKTVESAPDRHNTMNEEDKLHLYDFEVDENEPVAKKTKRKPILKMGSKKFRTYKKKKKVITVLPPLNLSNEENGTNVQSVAKVAQENSKNNNKKCTNSNDHNTSISSVGPALSVGNTSFCNEIDSSINSVIEAREQMLYSPQPYQSPKRDSLSVPIVRSSISHINENECIKSLNGSTSSSKYNATINSPFSAHFASPMYMGSSTPIRSHWTEQTNANLNANETDLENFDVSNYFGFNDSASIDEPFVSPIKYYATPGKTPVRVCRKPSPQKIPTSQVIRMLKFGADAINVSNDDDSQLDNSVELPEDFFHNGQTPDYDYSPGHTPPTPISLKMGIKNKPDKKKKKKVVIMEVAENLEAVDKSLKVDDLKNETTTHHNRNTRSRTRNTQAKEHNNTCTSIPETKPVSPRTRKHKHKEPEDSEPDDLMKKEVDIFGVEKNIKKPRRSYERPEYLRTKKHDLYYIPSDHEDEPELVLKETNIAVKEPQKKRNVLSKKDELELEKWAKAFNEQCMQVDSFNLVVE